MRRIDACPLDMGVIRVLLACGHPVMCLGLRLALRDVPRIRIDAEATDGPSVIELAQRQRPDVVIVDVDMPDMDGLEASGRIKSANPATRICLLSGQYGRYEITRGIEIGVSGFLLKSDTPEHFVKCIDEIWKGKTCYSPGLRDRIVSARGADKTGHNHSLTPREESLLRCLATGAALKQAAVQLGISYKAADHLKQKIMKKLDIHDRVELAQFAAREGLLARH